MFLDSYASNFFDDMIHSIKATLIPLFLILHYACAALCPIHKLQYYILVNFFSYLFRTHKQVQVFILFPFMWLHPGLEMTVVDGGKGTGEVRQWDGSSSAHLEGSVLERRWVGDGEEVFGAVSADL